MSEIPTIGFRGTQNIQSGAEWPFATNLHQYAVYTILCAYKTELLLVF